MSKETSPGELKLNTIRTSPGEPETGTSTTSTFVSSETIKKKIAKWKKNKISRDFYKLVLLIKST